MQTLTITPVNDDTSDSIEVGSLREIEVTYSGTTASTNQLQGSIDGVGWFNISSTLSTGKISVDSVCKTVVFLRNVNSSSDAGSLTITVAGHEER